MTPGTIVRAILLSVALLGVCIGTSAWISQGDGGAAEIDGCEGSRSIVNPGPVSPGRCGSSLTCKDPVEMRELLRFCRTAKTDSLPDIRRLARESSDPLVAGNALRAMGRLGKMEGEEVEGFLQDQRPRVRQEAVIALGGRRDQEAVQRLERIIEEGDPILRPLALRSLGRIGTMGARQVLERYARDPQANDMERAFAAAALASLP